MSVLRLTDHLLLIPNAELQRDNIILGSVNGAPSHLLFFHSTSLSAIYPRGITCFSGGMEGASAVDNRVLINSLTPKI